jgi:hypothetical protein
MTWARIVYNPAASYAFALAAWNWMTLSVSPVGAPTFGSAVACVRNDVAPEIAVPPGSTTEIVLCAMFRLRSNPTLISGSDGVPCNVESVLPFAGMVNWTDGIDSFGLGRGAPLSRQSAARAFGPDSAARDAPSAASMIVERRVGRRRVPSSPSIVILLPQTPFGYNLRGLARLSCPAHSPPCGE